MTGGERPSAAPAPLDVRLYSTLIRLVTDGDHRVVLSLGGGSVPGICGNLALCRLMEELRLSEHVDEVWGTSAGAAVGGSWASGTPALDVLTNVRALAGRRAVDLKWGQLGLAILLRPFGRRLPDGIIEGRAFRETLEKSLACDTFEETPVPFRCIACSDDGEARRKIFRRGPLLPAIFSSMSIPGIIIPRERLPEEPCHYYDGGLVEKTPLLSPIADHGLKGDRRKLIIIGTHYAGDTQRRRAEGFLNRFLYSIYALEDLTWSYQLAEARARPNTSLVILNPHLDDPNLFDFTRVDRNYREARETFADMLQNAKLALTFGLA